MATGGRSPRVWIDVELGATVGSPAGSIEVLQAFRNVIGPPTENDDRLAPRRQRAHYEGAYTEYEAVMQSIFRAVGSDRPAGRSAIGTARDAERPIVARSLVGIGDFPQRRQCFS